MAKGKDFEKRLKNVVWFARWFLTLHEIYVYRLLAFTLPFYFVAVIQNHIQGGFE